MAQPEFVIDEQAFAAIDMLRVECHRCKHYFLIDPQWLKENAGRGMSCPWCWKASKVPDEQGSLFG